MIRNIAFASLAIITLTACGNRSSVSYDQGQESKAGAEELGQEGTSVDLKARVPDAVVKGGGLGLAGETPAATTTTPAATTTTPAATTTAASTTPAQTMKTVSGQTLNYDGKGGYSNGAGWTWNPQKSSWSSSDGSTFNYKKNDAGQWTGTNYSYGDGKQGLFTYNQGAKDNQYNFYQSAKSLSDGNYFDNDFQANQYVQTNHWNPAQATSVKAGSVEGGVFKALEKGGWSAPKPTEGQTSNTFFGSTLQNEYQGYADSNYQPQYNGSKSLLHSLFGIQ